jgi:hypothetical protein
MMAAAGLEMNNLEISGIFFVNLKTTADSGEMNFVKKND